MNDGVAEAGLLSVALLAAGRELTVHCSDTAWFRLQVTPLSGSRVCAKSVKGVPGSGDGLLEPTLTICGADLPQVEVCTSKSPGALARPVASLTTSESW